MGLFNYDPIFAKWYLNNLPAISPELHVNLSVWPSENLFSQAHLLIKPILICPKEFCRTPWTRRMTKSFFTVKGALETPKENEVR